MIINSFLPTYSTGASIGGRFRHVCVTWQSDDGMLKRYVDGNQFAGLDISPGAFLPGGGIWIIGQDQDKLGGGFEKNSALRGSITEVHVWDRVLSPAEIKVLASTCNANMTGNYLAYSDFAIKGNVERFEPSCCKWSPTQSENVNGLIVNEIITH